MPPPDTLWTYLGTISIYLAVLMIPGGLIGLAAGLRGWALTGLAPLLTYTSIGLAGPWLARFGLPFDFATACACTLLLAGMAFGLCRLARRLGWISAEPDRPPAVWTWRAHLAVTACVVLATVLSFIVVLSASGGASAVLQRWDSVFHANGIRYISTTGDGSLVGMGTINWYPDGSFYPNAYHLVGALVYSLSGASIPAVLNAMTLPMAGMFALSLVSMIRQFGGRAVLAGATGLVAGAATTGVYESVSSGLLPFALGIAITPLAAVALARFLDRPGVDTGIVLGLSAVGLLAAHSSALFGAILFAFPLLLQRWVRREGKPLPDLLRLVPIGIGSLLIAAPHVLGAISFSSGGYPYQPWASQIPVTSALGQLLFFRQVLDEPQIWLSVLLVVGLVMMRTLGRLRWVVTTGVLFSVMFVLVACYGAAPWVVAFSRPWWNDRYRLMAMAAIPLCVLAGHGLAELQRLLTKAASSWTWVQSKPSVPARVGLVTAVVTIALMGVATQGFYTGVNATAVAYAYHNGPESEHREPPVTPRELVAMDVLTKLVGPGEMVLNDRIDGTAWVYAMTGIRPVAGHYDPGMQPPDAAYLAEHFREYDTDPEVRAAVKRLHIKHVFLGHGAIKAELLRAPGLRDLDGLDFLRRDYVNPESVIYTIVK